MTRYSDKKICHVCNAMPEGSVIELCSSCVTRPDEFVYFRGTLQFSGIKYCPFCGEELEEPND